MKNIRDIESVYFEPKMDHRPKRPKGKKYIKKEKDESDFNYEYEFHMFPFSATIDEFLSLPPKKRKKWLDKLVLSSAHDSYNEHQGLLREYGDARERHLELIAYFNRKRED